MDSRHFILVRSDGATDDRNTLTEVVFCFSPTADPNTLFRSNSLASKAMEQFMKVCAYLKYNLVFISECAVRGFGVCVCVSGCRDAVST